MALSDAAVAAHRNSELDSLAAASPAAESPSAGSLQAPDTPQAITASHRDISLGTDLDSTMMSMSSQTLSALPTPTHPSAIPAATAQALNNELGRSLLQVPEQGEEAAAQSPRSERLTSAYSGVLSCIADLPLHRLQVHQQGSPWQETSERHHLPSFVYYAAGTISCDLAD